ncbi:hypothetical protein B0T21DRAFT_354606 [Apiosordaria backusii]|uniref:Uncharacterized protein n=1 Tax=Apiosordaria backusii TaxID=314023 RepID=A0AA40EYB6_9PEZI|nr:hypothetical protein B0T21DRAFT_354606 [Apiosordaria backusii]
MAEAEKDPDFKKWRERTDAESDHRHLVHQRGLHGLSAEGLAQPAITNLSSYGFPNICNKSIPLYFVPAPGNMTPEYVFLHNYIYRRWVQPYRSEIEGGRFICEFFYLRDVVHSQYADSDHLDPTQDTIDEFISLNQALCAAIEAFRTLYLTEPIVPRARETSSERDNRELLIKDDEHQRYLLQHLFKALLLIVPPVRCRYQPSAEMGSLPVFLVRTGVEEDLSAPIDFQVIPQDKILTPATELKENVIKVTLETAVDFVSALEAREAAAVGLRLDPALFGGSTSHLVDMEKYPKWDGRGEEYDRRIMTHHEERELRRMRQIKEGNYYRHPSGAIFFGITEEEYKRQTGEK